MMKKSSQWAEAGLLYEVERGCAWLRLNRPEKRNAIDRPLRRALLEAIHEVSEDAGVRAAVITGNGSAFCSGADMMQSGGPFDLPEDRRRGGPHTVRDEALLYGWARLTEAIWSSEKVFLAAVNGLAVGAGCQLAFACDLIVASEKAQFWEAFVKRGLALDGGAAWLLPRLTSLVRAKEIAILGEYLSAADAQSWGLINRCVSEDQFESFVRGWADRLASGPTLRMGHIKSQLNASVEQTRHQSYREEAAFQAIGGGDDANEARQAAMERREPKFTGR